MFGLRSVHLTLSLLASWVALSTILASCPLAAADTIEWVPYTTDDGVLWFDNLRKPSLYTGSYGDCQGNSLVDLTRFDAALYKDNMTVMIHLEGTTRLQNQRVIMGVSVYAYGETRLNLMINPCTIDTPTLCPLRDNVTIMANGNLPIGADDLGGVPDIAYSIPDFEGQAILRLYTVENQTQIACYAASMTNGNSFSQPGAVGTILGLFTLTSLIASTAVTVYGQVVPEMRIHYAHSVSLFVVFSVFQHIFFTGFLSVNWPSVLPAFWSNFAWAAGMIHVEGMQKSINSFAGNKFGNITIVGGTPSNANYSNLGGGYDAAGLLQNTRQGGVTGRAANSFDHHLLRRTSTIETRANGFVWYGDRVQPGLPLPGNYSGFPGALAELSIPASNAFLTGLLWLLILLLLISTSVAITKLAVDFSITKRWARPDRWQVFRSHWLWFIAIAVLRLCYIAFFMLSALALFQFVVGGATSSAALAGFVFALLLIVLAGMSIYALWGRLQRGSVRRNNEGMQVAPKGRSVGEVRTSTSEEKHGDENILGSSSWNSTPVEDLEDRPHVHEDAEYIIKFGWLTGRFRRSKWWFFSLWLFYELIRACFYGAAAGNALVQIFGLLVWEIIAFITVVIMKPFESNRLNLVMVYLLGFSKVATTALSLAFDPRFALGRILTTVIGVVIIVIQGLLTICLLVAMTSGILSSYMSISRHKDNSEFRPRRWLDYRIRYFANIQQKSTDRVRPPTPPPTLEPEDAKEPTFAVSTVRRQPKIEDVGEEVVELDPVISRRSVEQQSIRSPVISRPASIRSHSSNVPFGARLHRASWSAKDLASLDTRRVSAGPNYRSSVENLRGVAARHRSASFYEPPPRPTSIESVDHLQRGKRRSTTISTPQRMKPIRSPLTRVHGNETSTTGQLDSAVDSWNPNDILPASPFPAWDDSSSEYYETTTTNEMQYVVDVTDGDRSLYLAS